MNCNDNSQQIRSEASLAKIVDLKNVKNVKKSYDPSFVNLMTKIIISTRPYFFEQEIQEIFSTF